MSVRGSLVLAAVLLLLPVAAQAQSLGEIAAKQRQKREAQKKPPAKVLTEADLEKAKGGTLSTGAGATEVEPGEEGAEETLGAAEGTTEAGSPDPSAKKADDEKVAAEKVAAETEAEMAAWRKKVEVAEKQIQAYKDAAATIQKDLNDPNLGQYSQGRQTLTALVEENQKNLVKAEQALEALQSEGRNKAYR